MINYADIISEIHEKMSLRKAAKIIGCADSHLSNIENKKKLPTGNLIQPGWELGNKLMKLHKKSLSMKSIKTNAGLGRMKHRYKKARYVGTWQVIEDMELDKHA